MRECVEGLGRGADAYGDAGNLTGMATGGRGDE